MKKNKKSIKKLSLHKNVVSSLDGNQVSGGTVNTLINCPQSIFCPSRFCMSIAFPCEIKTTLTGTSAAGGCPTTTYIPINPF